MTIKLLRLSYVDTKLFYSLWPQMMIYINEKKSGVNAGAPREVHGFTFTSPNTSLKAS